MPTPAKVPSVSVVVPVHNGGRAFERCVASISRGLTAADELIVVADGESDGAWRAAQNTPAKIVHNDAPRGPAHARNRGAREANGEILFFVDADVTVGPETLRQVRSAFAEQPGLAALIGSYDDAPAHPGFLSQYRNLLHHYTHQTAAGRTSTFWGACGALRRSVFEEVGGFDERYTTACVEDIDLGYRLARAGYDVELRKDIQVKHHKRWGAVQMIRTDVFARGVKWTELLFRYQRLDNNLNVDTTGRLSVLLAFALIVTSGAAPLVPTALLGTAGAAAALVALNRPFYAFLRRKRGTAFMLRALPWHWLYFAYSGMAFALGGASSLLERVRGLPPRPVSAEPC